MASFTTIAKALQAGGHVRHARWAAETKGFIQANQFVVQCGEGEPYPYDLSWQEIIDERWSVVAPSAALGPNNEPYISRSTVSFTAL